MNCEQARKIANHLFDGDEHPMEGDARRHIECCDACRRWYEGVVHITSLLTEAAEDLPEIDVADAVMRRLPIRHPAAERTSRAWIPRRVLAIAGVSWVLGALILMLIGTGLLFWLRSESGGDALVRAYGSYRTAVGSVSGMHAHVSTVAASWLSAVENIVPAHRGLGILFLGFVGLDCVLLLAIVAAWRLWPRGLRGIRILV